MASFISHRFSRFFRLILQMLGYGLAFLLLHRLAAYWGNASSFSLWFPPAGLRFALLWILGPRFGPAIAATELIAQIATGTVTGPLWWLTAIGTASSSLCYALGIALVRRALRAGRGSLATAPMPLGIAMLVCPLIAVIGSLPWALFVGPRASGTIDWGRILSESGTFWIGDLLGILMVAPPLLWLADRKIALSSLTLSSLTPSSLALPSLPLSPKLFEAAAVLGTGWAISALMGFTVGGIHIEPMLLCSVWVALRMGRMAAWFASTLVTALVLLSADVPMTLDARAELHLLAVSVAITSYLVGSHAEAESRMRQAIQRKERLLLQADRLKTLRAMSVAAIHDISQPLSTLTLEARYISELAQSAVIDRPELVATSAIIERKTRHLAELVRRMRAFGSGRAEEPAPVQVDQLLAEVAALTKAEAAAAQTVLTVDAHCPGTLMGCDVELQQALVNLVRNALAAAPGGTVTLRAIALGEGIELQVRDDGHTARSSRGMGLGLIIARTIAEAHGGALRAGALHPAGSCYALILPRGAAA